MSSPKSSPFPYILAALNIAVMVVFVVVMILLANSKANYQEPVSNNPVLIREINGIEVFAFHHDGQRVNVAIDYTMRRKVEEIYRKLEVQAKPLGDAVPNIGATPVGSSGPPVEGAE